MTALMAVLALVFGAMTLAGPALAKDDNPNKPDDPGNSANAPGQNQTPPGQTNTPPGQEPGDTPGASHDKMTICHFVEGKGETKDGYNIITMSEQAWAAHLAHHPGTTDEVYNGVSCPAQPPTQPPTEPPTEPPAEPPTGQVTCPSTASLNAGLPIPDGQTEATFCAITEEQAQEIEAALAATAPEVIAVAPVEAATVTEEPEAVAAPQPATVTAPKPATIPVAVPAGDGSSVPQTPVWALALLALGTVGLLASGTRLVTARSR